ncbi:MAG: OmpA family protein [Armatimonadetes bacterium]|nr:OmpA family protein [Armatimonadota bacterium]
MADGTPIIIKKKKGGGEHAHHGGSWKVAYADFVTAMMAFFMVMWIMGLSDQTKAQIQGYFNDPLGMNKSMPRSKNIITFKGMAAPMKGHSDGSGSNTVREDQNELKKVKKEIESKLAQIDQEAKAKGQTQLSIDDLVKKVELSLTDEGLRIEFHEALGAIFFESGKAVIRPQALALIKDIAPILVKSRRLMRVEGHTDAKPYGGAGYTNWDLSTDRAKALYHALQTDGMPESRFEGVMGYADTKLKNPENPYHFSNRRVTLLLPFGHRVDGTIDLPKAAFKNEVQGVFRDDVDFGPQEVNLPDQTKKSSQYIDR